MALPAPARATARLAVVLASLTMTTSACANDSPTGDGPRATSTGVTTKGTAADCFWSEAVTASSNNLQYPDSGATYWYSAYTVPAGASLRLTGTFPHARYLSFNVYGRDPTTGDPGHPLDALADVDIAADPGSANPYFEGPIARSRTAPTGSRSCRRRLPATERPTRCTAPPPNSSSSTASMWRTWVATPPATPGCPR